MRKPRLKISEERAQSYRQGFIIGEAKGLANGKRIINEKYAREQMEMERDALRCARVASYCAMMILKRHRGW